MRRQLPVFPLNTVLYPGGVLPLRIFETRYIDMVRDCLREDQPFVISLITSGSESGPAEFHHIGTCARIADWDSGPDGLLQLMCVGQQRVRIVAASVQANGLNAAEVEILPDPASMPVPGLHQRLADLLQRLIEKVDPPLSWPRRDDEADWVADRLCELLPLSLSQRQELLEIDDPVERLELIEETLPSLQAD